LDMDIGAERIMLSRGKVGLQPDLTGAGVQPLVYPQAGEKSLKTLFRGLKCAE